MAEQIETWSKWRPIGIHVGRQSSTGAIQFVLNPASGQPIRYGTLTKQREVAREMNRKDA